MPYENQYMDYHNKFEALSWLPATRENRDKLIDLLHEVTSGVFHWHRVDEEGKVKIYQNNPSYTYKAKVLATIGLQNGKLWIDSDPLRAEAELIEQVGSEMEAEELFHQEGEEYCRKMGLA